MVDWNRAAAEVFEIPIIAVGHGSMKWSELSDPLTKYLSEALPAVSGVPEEAMPEFPHPTKPERRYFSKVFYTFTPETEKEEEVHWYLFVFQDIVNWFEASHGVVNQKKLETIGELASGVAHDFNNLIMGIQSNAEAMLAQPNMPTQQHNNLVNIIRACTTGASLTRSLLGYAKRQPLTMASFNLVDLIHDVTRIAGVASSNHQLVLGKEFQPGGEPLRVVGSYSSLSHCLLNLIKNAREAMPDGGVIHLLWEGSDTQAVVTVRDHGTGIAPKDLEHIFEPFFSTKKQGTGLGLAMVRGILNQHSGTAEIRSTPGMGTAVSLTWPRGEASTPPAKGRSIDARRSTNRIIRQSQRMIMQSKRLPANAHYLIYVIDDDDLVREGLCQLLEHLGHRTVAFAQPEQALQALLSAQTRPELVIVDYNMPGMTGTQFISRYSTAVENDTRYADTQILLMSGLPPEHFQDFMSEFTQLKFGTLEKPFNLETLRKKLLEIKLRRTSGRLPQVAPRATAPVPKIVSRPNSSQLTSSQLMRPAAPRIVETPPNGQPHAAGKNSQGY